MKPHAAVLETLCNAALWRRLKPAEAVRVLADCYWEGAGAEVLLRAFLAERDMNRHNVRFWLRVYDSLSNSPSGSESRRDRPRP